MREKSILGRSGVRASAIGLGSSFGISGTDIERAFDHGINFFYWGTLRRGEFGKGIRELATRHRDEMVVVIQSYARVAALMKSSLNSALMRLGIDYADFLLLGLWNDTPPGRILQAAQSLAEEGKARHIMISCHHNPTLKAYSRDPRYGAIMSRYSAANTDPESAIFPYLGDNPPGVISFTATNSRTLLDPRIIPAGESVPTATDCYRFSLSNPHVNVCLAGPANSTQLDGAIAALNRGVMDEDELAWMRRVGEVVHEKTRSNLRNRALGIVDRFM